MKNYSYALSFIVTPLIALGTLSACGADDRILVGEILEDLRDGSDSTPAPTMVPTSDPTMVPTSTPTMVPGNDDPTTERLRAQEILDEYCGSCHNPMRLPGLLDTTAIDELIDRGMIVPGDPNASPFYIRMARDEMPPAGVEPRPGDEELETIANFIVSL